MKQKEIKLTRDVQGTWSYSDEDIEKECTSAIEVVAMFIARLAASIQMIDERNEEVGIQIVVKKS